MFSGRSRSNSVSILARAEARALRRGTGTAQRASLVSILARAEARALHPADNGANVGILFQSSRAPRRARCFEEAVQAIDKGMVSILARAEARALLRPSYPQAPEHEFQSSRAPRRARCMGCTRSGVGLSDVSILARAEARALPPGGQNLTPESDVSILARAEARALPPKTDPYYISLRFQSSRAPRRARCACLTTLSTTSLSFNPRARRGARVARVASRFGAELSCFNPRARRGARVAWRVRHLRGAPEVSILARAEARALRKGWKVYRKLE